MNRMVVDLVLNHLLEEGHPSLRRFLAELERSSSTNSNGNLAASASAVRRLVAGCTVDLEDALEKNVMTHLRVYHVLPRFASLLSACVCSKEDLSPTRRLRFRSLSFFCWLLISDLSSLVGGVKTKTDQKNHAKSVYFIDLVCHMPRFEEKYLVPWPYISEEDFERSFLFHRQYSERRKSQVDLEGEAVSRTLRYVIDIILPKQSMPSFYSDIPDVKIKNLVVAPCIWSHQYPSTGTKMAAFNFRQFLIRLSSETDGLDQLVTLQPNGYWFIPIGGMGSQIICFCGAHGSSSHQPNSTDTSRSIPIKRIFTAKQCSIVYRCRQILKFETRAVKLKSDLIRQWRLKLIEKLRKKTLL